MDTFRPGKVALAFGASQLALFGVLLAIWHRLMLDDSFIFLTYARNLARTGQFAFNPGEVSYGFSSPAYVVLLAAAARMTSLPVGLLVNNLLAALLCAISAGLVWAIWNQWDEQPTMPQMPLVGLVLSGPWFFTVWFLHGMETGLALTALLAFLLWIIKLHAGGVPVGWNLMGAFAGSVMVLTRLESIFYILGAMAIIVLIKPSRRMVLPIVVVSLTCACAEVVWLVYAHKTFGSYMPWTSTARLLFYIRGRFGVSTAAEFHHLPVLSRCVFTLKSLMSMVFGGPLRIMVMATPIVLTILILATGKKPVYAPVLLTALGGMLIQLVLFALLFPIAQIRHFSPYFGVLWALLVPCIVQYIWRYPTVRTVATGVLVLFWIAGAVHYYRLGSRVTELHQLARSGLLTSNDRIMAEPIGILGFESSAYIIDFGGLTDKTIWPLLLDSEGLRNDRVLDWALSRHATKLLLLANHCAPSRLVGIYCLVDVSDAREYMAHLDSEHGGSHPE